MTYCAACKKPCGVTVAEVGVQDHWDYSRELHYTTAVMGEVSHCCEADLTDPTEEGGEA